MIELLVTYPVRCVDLICKDNQVMKDTELMELSCCFFITPHKLCHLPDATSSRITRAAATVSYNFLNFSHFLYYLTAPLSLLLHSLCTPYSKSISWILPFVARRQIKLIPVFCSSNEINTKLHSYIFPAPSTALSKFSQTNWNPSSIRFLSCSPSVSLSYTTH